MLIMTGKVDPEKVNVAVCFEQIFLVDPGAYYIETRPEMFRSGAKEFLLKLVEVANVHVFFSVYNAVAFKNYQASKCLREFFSNHPVMLCDEVLIKRFQIKLFIQQKAQVPSVSFYGSYGSLWDNVCHALKVKVPVPMVDQTAPVNDLEKVQKFYEYIRAVFPTKGIPKVQFHGSNLFFTFDEDPDISLVFGIERILGTPVDQFCTIISGD